MPAIQNPTQSDDQRLHPSGKAERHDAEMLALLALLTVANLRSVASAWTRIAPPSYRSLASAVNASFASAPANRFWFDPERNQFGFGTRGYIPATAIRNAINAANTTAAAELSSITIAAGEGRIPLKVWQDSMMHGIKEIQLVNAAIGRGGATSLRDEDVLNVSQTVEYQFARLDRFAGQMEEAAAIGSPQAAGARAAAYAKSALATFGGMNRRSAEIAGFMMERNLLGNAEHCLPDPRRPHIPDCPSLSRMGWQPIGTMPPPGERLCLWNCRCMMDFARQ